MCLFAKSRAEAAAFTPVHYTFAAVMPSSQHPSIRAGAESIQLIYTGRVLRALSDVARQFRCNSFFGGIFLTFFFFFFLFFPEKKSKRCERKPPIISNL